MWKKTEKGGKRRKKAGNGKKMKKRENGGKGRKRWKRAEKAKKTDNGEKYNHDFFDQVISPLLMPSN